SRCSSRRTCASRSAAPSPHRSPESVVRAEFLPADEGDEVVGVARWDGRRAVVEAEDPAVRAALERIFKPRPVVVDDPSYRSPGARGESVIQPGNDEWFRAAAYT